MEALTPDGAPRRLESAFRAAAKCPPARWTEGVRRRRDGLRTWARFILSFLAVTFPAWAGALLVLPSPASADPSALGSAKGPEWPVAALAAQTRADDGKTRVSLWLQIPGEVFTADQDLAVEVMAEAVDGNGTVRAGFRHAGEWPSADVERIRGSGLKLHGNLALTPGAHRLRLTVTEVGVGVRSRRDLPFEARAFEEGRSAVLPPFFIDEDEEFEVLREPTEEGVVDPFTTADAEVFVPQVVPILEEGRLRSRITVTGYHLLKEQSLLDLRLVTAAGDLLGKDRLGMVNKADTGPDGFDRLDFSLQTEGLVPGDYQLEVTIQDLEKGQTDQALMPFSIR